MNINNLSHQFAMQNAALNPRDNSLENLLEGIQGQGTEFAAALESVIENAETGEATVPTGPSQLKRAAIEMESWFINQMFQAMRRTVPEGEGMFEMSNAERIWRDMLDEQTSQNLAESGGLGLAASLYEQLNRNS